MIFIILFGGVAFRIVHILSTRRNEIPENYDFQMVINFVTEDESHRKKGGSRKMLSKQKRNK